MTKQEIEKKILTLEKAAKVTKNEAIKAKMEREIGVFNAQLAAMEDMSTPEKRQKPKAQKAKPERKPEKKGKAAPKAKQEPDCDELIKEFHAKEKDKLKKAKEREGAPKPTVATIVKHKMESVVGSIAKHVPVTKDGEGKNKKDTKTLETLDRIEGFSKEAFANLTKYVKSGDARKIASIEALLKKAAAV